MSLPHKTKASSHILAINYRNFLFSLLMLVLISTLIVFNSAFASITRLPNLTIDSIGNEQQQHKMSFARAKIAFEEQEYVFAYRLMNVLAESGHVEAQYILATQYDTGLGVEKDVYMAYRWYKKAALAGLRTAQHNLAVAYAQGLGVKVSLNQAIRWWERAAKQGHTDSQFNLGIVYATGKGISEPDMTKALKWWHMAASNGDAAAQFNLGALYANGLGDPGTSCEAVHWLKKSEKNGFKQAHAALSQIQQLANFTQCK